MTTYKDFVYFSSAVSYFPLFIPQKCSLFVPIMSRNHVLVFVIKKPAHQYTYLVDRKHTNTLGGKKLIDACHCCKNHLRQRVNTAFSGLYVLKVTRFLRYFGSLFFIQSSVEQAEMRVNEFHKPFCFIIPFGKIKPLIFFSFLSLILYKFWLMFFFLMKS